MQNKNPRKPPHASQRASQQSPLFTSSAPKDKPKPGFVLDASNFPELPKTAPAKPQEIAAAATVSANPAEQLDDDGIEDNWYFKDNSDNDLLDERNHEAAELPGLPAHNEASRVKAQMQTSAQATNAAMHYL